MKRQKVLIKDRPSCSRTDDEIDDEKFEEDRRRIQTSIRDKSNDEITIDIKTIGDFSTVAEAYEYIRQLCLRSSLIQERSLPPIVWRHQLYSLFDDMSKVDVALETMIDKDMIRIICHGESSRENDAIIRIDDFVNYYRKDSKSKNLFIELFITKVIQRIKHTEYSDKQLNDVGFLSEALSKLSSLGLLTKNDLDQRQLSFAGIGIMVRTLNTGREQLIKILKKARYSQLLESELIKRFESQQKNVKNLNQFGLEFHLYDLYGRKNLVKRRSANLPGDSMIQLIFQ
ncbi:serine/threonine-protein kinase 19-like protein [Euroglyphus maynei]|uniref:Serine/threonine-protein kinase 19-like protein n=1 Tax=Euroglyphus maynei TaxID=6958 RepID=A0A1Y3BC49_EURMA|nr:serine/threonine-protein kinase 19-like protein [Euroglyphus maynei]